VIERGCPGDLCRSYAAARCSAERASPLYNPGMAVLAAPIALQSVRPAGVGILLVLVLLVGLATVAYIIGREYVSIGRGGPRRVQSLRDWYVLGLAIVCSIVLIGRYWK
jgi:hypothetical protein